MDHAAFDLLQKAESSWWYAGRSAAIRRMLDATLPPNPARRILDVGAGYGGMRSLLQRYGTVSALEPDADAREACRRRGYSEVYEHIPDTSSTAFDLLVALDVVEHVEDDLSFLKNLKPLIRKDGAILITVPAHPSLWSRHDVQHQHFRRYTTQTLRDALRAAGFEITRMSYWNALLAIPAFIARRLGFVGSSSFDLPRPLNRIVSAYMNLEARAVPSGMLPIGVSLICLAKPSVYTASVS